MRNRVLAIAVLACLPCLTARGALAEDPPSPPNPPAAPPGTKKPAKAPVPEIVGIHWESDLQAGLRRAAREGRPVFIAFNALEGEGANEMLAREAYPSEAWGKASRPFVCFVANNETHAEKPGCARFGGIPCQAHKDALGFAFRKFGSLISPQHAILEPDGGVAYHKDYFTGEESGPFLDAWAAKLAPRIVVHRVWTVREERLKALSAASVAETEKLAKSWLESGDGLAPAGVVALLDQETNHERRAALFAALRSAPPEAESVLFDAVDIATGAPDADAEETFRWVDVTLAVAPDLGDWAAARVVARTKDKKLLDRVVKRWETGDPAKPVDLAGMPVAASVRLAEALTLRGDKSRITVLSGPKGVRTDDAVGILGGERVARAGGLVLKFADAMPLADALKSPARDVRRGALDRAAPDDVRAAREVVRAALTDSVEEVRVVAAIALRRAGDPSGAAVLLAALADPVEGPEVRHALVAWRGEDLGDDPSAWEEAVRAAEGGGK